MFTGIIAEIGLIVSMRRSDPCLIEITAPMTVREVKPGDSVSVSGACLTVIQVKGNDFKVEVSSETLQRTCIRDMKLSDKVNLELAMPANGRFDGHIVQGHVDMAGRISGFSGSKTKVLTIRPETNPGPLIVEKGSIAVNGVSLTVSELKRFGEFSVVLVPITIERTTLGQSSVGQRVNLEFDIIGKYVAQNVKF